MILCQNKFYNSKRDNGIQWVTLKYCWWIRCPTAIKYKTLNHWRNTINVYCALDWNCTCSINRFHFFLFMTLCVWNVVMQYFAFWKYQLMPLRLTLMDSFEVNRLTHITLVFCSHAVIDIMKWYTDISWRPPQRSQALISRHFSVHFDPWMFLVVPWWIYPIRNAK